MKRKIIKELARDMLANSCEIGAMHLERLANGETESPELLRGVACGMRDAVQNANVRHAEIMVGIMSMTYHYFRRLDDGIKGDFFEKRIREYLSELKKNEIDTFDVVYPKLGKLRRNSYPYIMTRKSKRNRDDEKV